MDKGKRKTEGKTERRKKERRKWKRTGKKRKGRGREKRERGGYPSWGEGWLLVLRRMDADGPYLKAVFFNLFVAVEPYISVKVTRGTP